jgi:hypothetical protein
VLQLTMTFSLHRSLSFCHSVFLSFCLSSMLFFPPAFCLILISSLPLSFSYFFDSSLLLFSPHFSSLTQLYLMIFYFVSSDLFLFTLPFFTLPSSRFSLSSSPFFSALILSCLGLTGNVRSGCRRCLRDIQPHDRSHRLGCHN